MPLCDGFKDLPRASRMKTAILVRSTRFCAAIFAWPRSPNASAAATLLRTSQRGRRDFGCGELRGTYGQSVVEGNRGPMRLTSGGGPQWRHRSSGQPNLLRRLII